MTSTEAQERMHGFRTRLLELPLFKHDRTLLGVLANVHTQVQYTEGLLNTVDLTVSEEALLNIGYISGLLEIFEPRELSIEPMHLLR